MKALDEYQDTELRLLEKPGQSVPAMGVLKRAKKQRGAALQQKLENSEDPFVVLDENSCVVWANDAWHDRVGSESTVKGKSLDQLFEAGWRYQDRLEAVVTSLDAALAELDMIRAEPDRARILELAKLLYDAREDAAAVQKGMNAQPQAEGETSSSLAEGTSPGRLRPSTGEFHRFEPTAMVEDVHSLLAMERALEMTKKR